MARAVLFDAKGRVVEPSAVLRKRPLLIDRGRFETIEPFHVAMLRAAEHALRSEGKSLGRDPQALLEITLHPALDDDAADDQTILARVQAMTRVLPALVTDLAEGFRLVPYLRRYTAEPIRLVGGVTLLARILQSQFYHALPGALLEGMGKLFAGDVTFYTYPMPREAVIKALGGAAGMVRPPDPAAPLVGADDLLLAPPVSHLYRYLRDAGHVVPIEPLPP
jgi:hypothetical protein